MRAAAALLILATLQGCNALAIGALALPAPSLRADGGGRAFVLDAAPGGSTGDATPGAGAVFGAPEVGLATGAAEPSVNHVRLLGVALVPARVTGLANVHDGRVTGTALRVLDAGGGRRIASAVTFYDGSFEVDVAFRGAKIAVVLALDLVAGGVPVARTTLSSPILLQAGEPERRIPITPGSTALTSFLGAVAVAPDAGQKATPKDLGDVTAMAGDRFQGLIAGLDDDERESFTRLAEASPELTAAADLRGIDAGIRGFVGRLTVPPVSPIAP